MNLEIKAQLVRNGIKIKDVAAEANVARSTVSVVLNGHQNSRPIKETIARMLNMEYGKLNKLWRKAA